MVFEVFCNLSAFQLATRERNGTEYHHPAPQQPAVSVSVMLLSAETCARTSWASRGYKTIIQCGVRRDPETSQNGRQERQHL
mmetsp:Transcript_56374/g.115313  ORF Transcript_56374/g.115313 Transcript_56374/m.115313 type:complete len:82 (+) Transcript_56374:93-338(+)